MTNASEISVTRKYHLSAFRLNVTDFTSFRISHPMLRSLSVNSIMRVKEAHDVADNVGIWQSVDWSVYIDPGP